MKQTEWKALKDLTDAAADEIRKVLMSGAFAKVRQGLQDVSGKLPEKYSINLEINLTVFDDERGTDLPLIQSGLTTSDGKEAYLFTGDSSEHRYLVNGELCEVPHDYCPHCWGQWDFKLQNDTCPECEFTMGEEIKLLLDENICPNCEEGEVRRDQSICSKCGFEVDGKKVAWG